MMNNLKNTLARLSYLPVHAGSKETQSQEDLNSLLQLYPSTTRRYIFAIIILALSNLACIVILLVQFAQPSLLPSLPGYTHPAINQASKMTSSYCMNSYSCI